MTAADCCLKNDSQLARATGPYKAIECCFVPLCGLVVAHVKPQIQRGRWIEDNIPSLKVEDYALWDGRWRKGAQVILRQIQFLLELKDISLSLFQQRPMKGTVKYPSGSTFGEWGSKKHAIPLPQLLGVSLDHMHYNHIQDIA